MKTKTLLELMPPKPTLWVKDDTICIPVPDAASSTTYDIELARIDTPLKLLAWVNHLAAKPWMDKPRLREFIRTAAQTHGFDLPHQL